MEAGAGKEKSGFDFTIIVERIIKEMELKVNEVQLPDQLTFNYEELKQELAEKVSMYEAIVYTDDNIKTMKEDRAKLNKLKKALNDERIRREKEYMKPFNEFKTKIDELIGIIDKPVSMIGAQLMKYEEELKVKKGEEIDKLFDSMGFPDFVELEMLFDRRWFNSSISLKKIGEELKSELNRINDDISTLSNLPEFSFEATEVYKSTLDINKAIAEGKKLAEIAKAKAVHEAGIKAREEEQARVDDETEVKEQATVAKQVENDNAQWINFSACLTVEQAKELKQFFNSRGIKFRAI